MHKYEVALEVMEVKQMIAQQFPAFSYLPVTMFQSFGTVNSIYRLGEAFSVRVPKIYSGVQQLEKEEKWLPVFTTELPLKIPALVAVGESTEKYPWKWGIYEWIEGENSTRENLANMSKNLKILASFIQALHHVKTDDVVLPGEHNYRRGEPLVNRDNKTRETLYKLRGEINYPIAMKVWEDALSSPLLESEKKWIHGDLQSGNMLTTNGLISAIIDFGALGFGDMACDLMPAWNLMNSDERKEFKKQFSLNETVWKRAKGWALTVAAVALQYYKKTNPSLSEISKFTIDQISQECS